METRAPPAVPARGLSRIGRAVGRSFAAQQGHFFAWSPVCLGAGVGLYFASLVEPKPTWIAAGLIATAILWGLAVMARAHRGTWVAVMLWALTLAVLGAALASFRAHNIAAPVLNYRYYGPVEGRVVAIDRSASQKVRLTLDRVRLNRVAPHRTPAFVRISLHGPPVLAGFQPGDVVMTTGHLGPPSGPVEPGGFDFQRHLWFKQLGALGYTRNPVLRSASWEDQPMGLTMKLYRFRLDLAAAIKTRMGGTEGPFAAAIITGDRTDLDPDAVEMLRASNLAHLLAISGLHMGLITGAVFAVVRLLVSLAAPVALRINGRKVAAVAAFAAALIYLGISGASIATQRAFIMVSVMLLAICLERPALSLRAVAIAALLVLVFTPEALIGPGFQMSFAATVALVAVFGAVRDYGVFLAIPSWARGALSLVLSSFVAGLATGPYGAAHFNQLAQYGLLANLLSVPVMGIVVMPGALAAALLSPLGLEGIGLGVMRLGLGWILWVAEMVTGLGGSTRAVVAPGPWVLPLITLGGLMLCLWRGAGRLVGTIPVVVALGMWTQTVRPEILISDTGRLMGVMREDGRALNKDKGDGFAARVWLENDGDKADQMTAAQRASGMGRNEGQVSLGAVTILFDARNPDVIDVRNICGPDVLVIVPRVEAPLPNGCRGLTQLDFLNFGAHAISAPNSKLTAVTSRDIQGERLWTPPRRATKKAGASSKPRPKFAQRVSP